jgi:hypothetical protein
MESAEDAVSKKRLESERVRMDVQNQNDSSLPIKHHWARLRELTNIRSKNIQLINAKNTVDVKGNVLQTKLDGTDIDGTREVAVRDRQVRIHRQQSIDEIDSVRKSLVHYRTSSLAGQTSLEHRQ